MENNVIDLYTLQTHLKTVLEGAFPARLWVKAEISAVKARPGGHCYMELSQSDGNGLVAKVTAIIWSSKFRFLAPYAKGCSTDRKNCHWPHSLTGLRSYPLLTLPDIVILCGIFMKMNTDLSFTQTFTRL